MNNTISKLKFLCSKGNKSEKEAYGMGKNIYKLYI